MLKRFRAGFGQALFLSTLTSVLAAGLWGQSTLGGIRGTVSDPSGAPISNVKVTLTNAGTGEPRSTLTNGSGSYDFSAVVPSTYIISAEAASFKKFERTNVVLGTQEFLTVDLGLEVGQVSESVTVTESVPLVEASNASQGQVLDNQKLVDLPNLGRNPFMMSRLSANVIQVGPPAYNRMEDQSGSSEISIAGGPIRGNNYLLDGIPITDANNRAIIIPSLEAIQEVKVQANTYDAEMARTGGGMFNTLMRSGANDYHGSAYGHLRRTDWDANAFFSNAAGIPISPQPNTTWGASFGGRVWIPKLYNGKNKTFFWLAVEHYDDEQSDSSAFALPTAAERTGNFVGSGVTVLNPLTGQPYAGNIIPSSALNPVGQAIANLYPLPTSTPSVYGGDDLTLASAIKARAVQYTAKVDEDFTSWWRASLSYLRYYSLEPGDTWFNSPATQDGWRLLRRVDATQLNNIFTINPTTVLSVRYGFNRFPNYDYNSSQGFNIASLGFSPAYASTISPALAEFPSINMSNLYGLGDSGDNGYYDEYSHNFSVAGNKYIGRHSLKAGFDFRKLGTAGYGQSYPTGSYSFNSCGQTYTGVDLGDLLTGYPCSREADTFSHFNDTINYYGLFAQDDFRMNSKLTINFGLRWERENGVQEQHNALITGFNTKVPNVLANSVSGISPLGAVEYAGVGGAPTHVGNYSGNKFAPRIGVAYQLTPKTILRGGYGIFYAPQIALGGPISTLGYSATTSYNASVDSAGNPTPTLTNPFPNGLIQPSGNTLGTAAGIGQSFSLVDPSAKSTRVQQYSFDVQRELPMGIALEVGYVGSHTTDLTLGSGAININALNPSYFSLGADALNASVANPYYAAAQAGLVPQGTLSGQKVPQYQLLLPYSAYQSIKLIFNSKNHASYNSGIIKAQKRFSKGLTFLSSLTWSRNMDETNNPAGNALNGGAQGAPQNPYDLAAEYSLSNFDTPLRWASSFSYDLPVGKGRPLNISNGILDAVVGGWSINSVVVYQTGFPLQVYQSDANSSYGFGAQRPNATGASAGTSGSVEQRLNDYINPAAFSLAPAASFGNVSRTLSLLGPGQKNWDISLFKSYSVKERFKAQFRLEALNGFNSPLFSAPNTKYGSGSFGVISSQQNFARQLQLALRFSF